MNNTKHIIFLSLIIMMLSACNALGSDEDATFTVGILAAGGPAFQPAIDGFIDGMAELDHTDGENITYLYAEEGASLEETAQSYVDQNVDMILTVTNSAARTAAAVTDTVPIVAAIIPYSVELGLADSLSAPGGNYTGIDIGPVTAQRFQLLIDIFPEIERVYIPMQADDTTTQIDISILTPLASDLGVELVIGEFSTIEDVEAGIAEIPDNVDAIFTPSDVVIAGQLLPNWSQEAISRGIPHTHISRASQGPIFTFGPNLYANGFQAASLAHQIHEGISVGEIPIEIGEFSLTINLQTAEAAGLEISDDMLRRANEIIRSENESGNGNSNGGGNGSGNGNGGGNGSGNGNGGN